MIYDAYEHALTATLQSVRQVHPGFSKGLQPVAKVSRRRLAQRFLPGKVKNFIRRFLRL